MGISRNDPNSIFDTLIGDGRTLLVVVLSLFTSCNENTTPMKPVDVIITAGDSTSSGIIYGISDQKLLCGGNGSCESTLSIGPAKFKFLFVGTISTSGSGSTVTAEVTSPNTFVSVGPDMGRLRAHQYGDSISNKLDWGSTGQSWLMHSSYTPTSGTPAPYVPGPWEPPGYKYMGYKAYEGAAVISGWIKVGYSGGYWRMKSYGYVEN